MAIHCMLLTKENLRIVQNFLSEFKDKYDCMQTFDMVRSMISAWQSANFKDGEEPTMPTKDEIEQFIQSQLGEDKQSSIAPAGDKRFSALNATFAEGTIIDGVDVSGKTIEYVYQNVIKKSGKGKAPAKDSKLNLLNSDNFSTIFKNFPKGVTNVFFGADDKVPRVIFKAPNGEVGQIIYEKNRWRISRKQKNSKGEEVFYSETLSPEDINKIVNRFIPNKFREYVESGQIDKDYSKDFQDNEGRVQQFFRENYNIHLINEYFFEKGKHETFEDFSYYEGYLPLWQEWAKQNPALISELKAKSAGKTLTDKFARTKVSQARALTDILNNFNESEFTRKIDSIDNQITDDMDESDIVNLLVKNGIIEKGYWGILGREIIMANINGVKIPFYRSSNGTSGKKAGKWYQFFGFGNMDSSSKDNDWFIKGSSKNNNEIENGYGSIDIQRLTALFNKYLNWTGKHDKMNMHSVYDFTEKGTEGGNHDFLGPQRTEDINTILYGTKDKDLTGINARKALEERVNMIKTNSKALSPVQDSNNLLKNINNVDKSLVDVEQYDKPWKSDPTKSNKTLRVYLKDHSKGYFELVKDVEDNFYSVHFKTAKEGAKYNAENTTPTTKEERKILFKELIKLIPEGAKISTWGSISDEGIKALDNVGRDMIKVGERTITKKTDGSKVNIPIYQKQDTTSTQEEAPIQEDDKSYSGDLARCARQMSPIERKHRVERITRMFSSIVNSKLKDKLAAYNDKIQAETNPKVKNDLLFGRKKITRFSVIKSEGVQSIMMEVRKAFQVYVDAPLEAKIEIEKQQILAVRNNLDDRIATNMARNVAERKTKAFQNVLNNFQVLAEESLGNLALTEGISVNLNSSFVLNTQENSDTFNEEGKQTNQGDVFEKEESLKDGWMTDVRQVATFDSLTARVRQAIGNMVRYDSTGKVDRDDLGDNIYLNAGYVHSELIQALRNMISAEDMIPMLEQLSKKKVWVKQIINELNNDNQLFTEFYRAYRKDYVNYFIQKVSTNSDTSTSTKVMSINGAEGTAHYFDEWRDNYEYGNILTTDSIYDKNGDIQLKNAKVGLDLVDSLLDIFEDRETIAENLTDENIAKIKKAMNMLGASVDSETLENALKFNLDNKAFKPAVNVLLSNLRTIYYDLNKGNEKIKDGEYADLLNIHGTAFNNIAEVINKVDEDTIESSVRQGDKTMYAHINPSYVTTLIKKLQRKDTYKQVLDNYRVCNWFNKNGKWRNSILEEIENNAEVRSNLKHVVLLQYNRKEYNAWTDLDATLALYNMYMTGAADRSGNETYGYYQVPMLSDAQSAEFIKFKRYKKGYEEKLLDKFKDLVYQEIDRINLVKERATTDNHIDPIANFDMDDKKMGGAEFKFFPELNQKGQSGKTFLQAVDEAKQISMDEVDNLIKDTIKSIMDSRFNEAVQHYKDIGLYDRIGTEKNARFKHVNMYSEEGMNDRMREWFWNSTYFTSQFIELTTTDLAYYKNLEDFQKRNKQDHAPAERLNTLATWKGEPVLVNNDGSRRTARRVIYLKDNILPANSMDSINEILEARVKDKDDAFTAYDKAAIMSIFNKVNVADAQAYNTLPSFRSTQIMAGMWSDAEETAYNNIMDNKWTASDFLVLWNTRKPYLYTQKNQPDGMGGIMKVPTQHKNSEFLLLTGAMFGQILHSSKLQALNDFMVKNNIDSAMFESAVKDGLQGTINLNDATNYASTMIILENATRLNGKENPNVVHEFDYNDYGIQTSTPEHGIDKVQLVGTQIRRLISSDMNPNRDPNFKLKYKDREFTQQEWFNYFNAINTANIQEAFKEVSDKFNDIHEVEKELIREVRSNPRYGTDLIRALTLDENGNFNIPLIDPSQTLRIQALLNSILKNRVTKQKINGGALIQASPFGLDESKQPQIVYNEDGSIKYFEAYLPCPTEELYNALLDPNTHELDINKKDSKGNYIVPEKYREVIGYRV